MRHDLIDEYRLFVSPVVLGAGNHFFTGLEQSIGLALLETHTFGTGVVYLRYERRAGCITGDTLTPWNR